MGFQSPAQDYVESRLDLNRLFAPHPNHMLRIETPGGFALIDRSLQAKPGDTVAFQFDDYPQLGKLFSTGIITQDGETLEGNGLEGVVVLGKVTAEVLTLYEPYRPTI